MDEAIVSKSEKVHTGSDSGIEVGTSMPVVSEPNEKVQKVIVAVHGIGDQFSFATIQSVVNRFCVYYGQPAAIPLGRFHSGGPGYSLSAPYPSDPFERLAFAEVYWAPIAREVAQERHTLEGTKIWARTIVERLRLRWHEEEAKKGWQGRTAGVCSDDDFQLTQQVLTEMIQTVAVVERLCFLADKAGLFTFDLRSLLDDYLGDVQIVAEFKTYRDEILSRFNKLLGNVEKAFPKADIYLVTHSEGTVVALLGLLQAFREPIPLVWTQKIRGLMTLGSPIDKHLALWPELFGEDPPNRDAVKALNKKIEWRNYYDFGDPVGFRLDSIREWIDVHNWGEVFNFQGDKHDYGFARYPFPGKAHVDYWTDQDLFDHFISTVVMSDVNDGIQADGREKKNMASVRPVATQQLGTVVKSEKTKPAPGTRKLSWVISYVLPYIGIFALLFMAAYTLYKAIGEATMEAANLQAQPSSFIFTQSAGLAALLFGVTILARVPRLTYDTWSRFLSFAIAVLGAVACMLSVREAEPIELGRITIPLGFLMLGLAVLVVPVATILSLKFPSLGLIPLMFTGMVAVMAMVVYYVQDTTRPLWPVFLATGAFFYLWWLSALLFDLIFVWHVYIRRSRLLVRINCILGTYRERARSQAPAQTAAGAAG